MKHAHFVVVSRWRSGLIYGAIDDSARASLARPSPSRCRSAIMQRIWCETTTWGLKMNRHAARGNVPDKVIVCWWASVVVSVVCLTANARADDMRMPYSVGVAQVDITPDYQIRLSGFGFRRTESEGVRLPIWAKALAISDVANDPVVLITVDNLGIPVSMRNEVARRLAEKTGLKTDRLSIAASHTHTAPMLHNVAPTLFSGPIPEEHQQRIDRYTTELTDKLEQVATAALKDRQPAQLFWGIGQVAFAMNRRTKGGPVDHDLPLLVVKNPQGQVRAIYVNYACHCVTLSENKIGGDWAGYAQDVIQRDFPSAVAMVSIGCGADQNPSTGVVNDKADLALQQGVEMAAEVKRMLSGFLAPVGGAITTKWKSITLDFAELPTRSQWEERAKKTDAEGYHARVQLARLDRGEALQTTLDYPIASWAFGDSLAMVFLPGEVVVDYSLRLKRELDGRRLWVTAYANDAPCYIPSERVLKEGGYEASGAMFYYDRPGPLKAGLEARIVDEVHGQLDKRFSPPFDPKKTQGSLPKSPHQSLAALQTTPNLQVDVVAAEPLISDPVAIDFGLDGSMWVAEMSDYPTGASTSADDDATRRVPSGRIRLVRDRDRDGQFDASSVFLDGIPFPTGVTAWRDGVLICSAPDILYAEDTDGDDRADVVKKLFTGFGTSNNQARVNSLCYGLDGWIHGSCGLFGGTITNFKDEVFELGDRDFRMKPDTGEFEPATGRTQQGRIRDEFGHWFGCDNSNLGYHYPLSEDDLKRNPFVASPASRVDLARTDEARRLYPARADAQRFQLSGAPGSVTAACGIGVYRDSQLGDNYAGNLFVCEPVNLLVHRMIPKRSGTSFAVERAANESQTEFLRSNDGWFRPVQAVTGPDGNLWIVDMYRFIIEDPRWIPPHELAPLDVRAGSGMGRIYRVRKPSDSSRSVPTPPATMERGHPIDVETFAVLVQNPAYREQVLDRLALQSKRSDSATAESIPVKLPEDPAESPTRRMIRYRWLSAQNALTLDDIRRAMTDSDAAVREYGIRMSAITSPKLDLLPDLIKASRDEDAIVRLNAACMLGHWTTEQTGKALAMMAIADADDAYVVAAVYSSLNSRNLQSFTSSLFAELAGRAPPASLMSPLLSTAVGLGDNAAIKLALETIVPVKDHKWEPWQFQAMAQLRESLNRRGGSPQIDPFVVDAISRVEVVARALAFDERTDDTIRLATIQLLGHDEAERSGDVDRLGRLLSSQYSPAVQMAAVECLERIASDRVPKLLTAQFTSLSPSVQSRVIDTFLSRDAWMQSLFAEFESGSIPTNALTAAQRQELIGHPERAIADRARNLLAANFNADRQQVLEQYRDALERAGDLERGRAVFTKTCSQCHKLGDVGHQVGPNLAMAANKTPAFLLQEILDPNRNVDSRYVSYVAETKQGLIRTGILASESAASVTLLAAEGKRIPLLRDEIDELRASGKSLMPEGLEKDLSVQAVSDILAFLSSTPAIPKQIDGNTPSLIKPTEGRLNLAASMAAIFGDQIIFEPPFGNIGYWHGVQDHVVWSIELSAAQKFDVYMDFACAPDSAGNRFRVDVGRQSLAGQVVSTGGWDKYSLAKLGELSLDAGKHRVIFRPDESSLRGALADLRALHLVPVGQAIALAAPEVPEATNDVAVLAHQILDDKRSDQVREELIADHPTKAAELVAAMTVDMPNNIDEEYRRIPWIWRVSIACGRRDDAKQLRALLDISLPKRNHKLHDWQAVVIGGGVINGLSLQGVWPQSRLNEILRDHPDLHERFTMTVALASRMADDEHVRTGTRYDALRIVAFAAAPHNRDQLAKYLAKGTDDELQMGAISGISDIDSAEVPKLLLSAYAHLNAENRVLVLDAMLRTDARRTSLLDAIANGRIDKSQLGASQQKRLLESKSPELQRRAKQLLDPQ